MLGTILVLRGTTCGVLGVGLMVVEGDPHPIDRNLSLAFFDGKDDCGNGEAAGVNLGFFAGVDRWREDVSDVRARFEVSGACSTSLPPIPLASAMGNTEVRMISAGEWAGGAAVVCSGDNIG